MTPLSAKAVSESYGFTARHWIRLAAAGKIPGAWQPSGAGGKWMFDKPVFERWGKDAFGLLPMPPTLKPRKKKPPKRGAPDRIYLVYSAGMVKIGITNNFGVRSQSFKTASAAPIHIIFEFSGTYTEEFALHNRFHACRSHGEWFRLSPALREFISEKEALCHLEEAEAIYRKWLVDEGHIK